MLLDLTGHLGDGEGGGGIQFFLYDQIRRFVLISYHIKVFFKEVWNVNPVDLPEKLF